MNKFISILFTFRLHYYYLNLFMILRRLFPFSIIGRPKSKNIPNCFLFSTKQQQQAKAPTQQPQASQQNINVQEVVALAQQAAMQSAKQMGFKTPRNNLKNNQKYGKGKSRNYQVEDYQALGQYLMFDKKQVNKQDYFDQLSKITNPEQLKKRIQQIQSQLDNQKNKRIQNYQNRINLTPQQLIFRNLSLNGSLPAKQKKHGGLNIKNELFKNFNEEDIKQFYRGKAYEGVINNRQIVVDLLKVVYENHDKSSLLNLLYEKFVSSQSQIRNLTISNHELNKIVDLIAAGELHNANPLKFYWFTFKYNPQTRYQLSLHMLKQLNKVTINDKNVSKLLKIASLNFLGEDLSTKIINKIVVNSNNVNETIKLWILTSIVASRIKTIKQSSKQTQINFNDILALTKNNKDKNTKYFLTSQLPKLFFESGEAVLYQNYKKALIYFQQNSRDSNNIIQSQLQQKSQINFGQSQPTTAQYVFQNDLNPQKVVLNPRQNKNSKSVQNIIKTQFKQYDLVQSIIKGQYQKALKYYAQKFCTNSQQSQKLNNLAFYAKSEYQDPNAQALFVLRQIFKESKYKLNPQHKFLMNSQLSRFFSGRFGTNQSRGGQPNRNQKGQRYTQSKGVFKNMTQRQKPKGVFSHIAQNKFSTQKELAEQKKQDSNQQYQNYLKVVKQTQKSAQKQPQQPALKQKIFNFDNCKTVAEVQQQFKKHIESLNQKNIRLVTKQYRNVPEVGNISVLIKYYFLNSLNRKINSQKTKGLIVEFNSSSGEVYKDYGEYLKGNSFNFALPDQIYQQMLALEQKKVHRHKFKKIVAHIIMYKKSISESLVSKICQICSNQKMGLTLLQIINLMNAKQSQISYESLKKIASSIQNFKGMQSDLLQFVRRYCDRTNTKIQTKLFQPYIVNLVYTEKYQALNAFFDTLRSQFKIKQYKLDAKLSPQQNIKKQKEYKDTQSQKSNKQLFEMIRIVSNSLKPRTKIPSFIPQILDIYLSKKKQPVKSNEYGVALIVNSQNQNKFIDLLNQIKSNPQQNNQIVLQAQIRCLLLFGRTLKQQFQKILNATLYEKQLDLTQSYLKNFGYIFKQIDAPSVYTQYLEYVLKKQPTISPQIKNLYYKVFNSTTDDFSKHQMNSLLDYLFNPNKEKDRIQYKKVKLEQERKSKMLKSLMGKKEQKTQEENKNIVAKSQSMQAANKKVDQKTVENKLDDKQVKKTKKQKKAQSQQKGVPVQKKSKNKQKDLKNQALLTASVASTKVVDDTNLKRQLKNLQKFSTVISYDQNNRPVYHEKLCKLDHRRQSINTFISAFMQKFEIVSEQDTLGKQKQKKSKKGKQQPKKQTGSKKPIAKEAKKN